MFATILSPENLKPTELDFLLANGWYRMGQNVFTTHFLCFKNCFYSALWLRVGLLKGVEDAKFKQLKKINHSFRIEIQKASVTPQHEALYKLYRQSVAFDPSETLQSLLYGYATYNQFDTYEINMYDGKLLIGAGFFDLGQDSAAGIVSFYNPDYKKYSPGKFIIYSKIEFCRQKSISYFYPGYVVPGYAPFDYKTSIGKATLEYFSVIENTWLVYKSFSEEKNPLGLMRNKLEDLNSFLNQENINNKILYYRFFDANLDPYYSKDMLLDYPIFLYCKSLNENGNFTLVVYDICHEDYCVIECSPVLNTDWYKESENIFSSHLLRVDKTIFSTRFQSKIREILTNKSTND